MTIQSFHGVPPEPEYYLDERELHPERYDDLEFCENCGREFRGDSFTEDGQTFCSNCWEGYPICVRCERHVWVIGDWVGTKHRTPSNRLADQDWHRGCLLESLQEDIHEAL